MKLIKAKRKTMTETKKISIDNGMPKERITFYSTESWICFANIPFMRKKCHVMIKDKE